MIGKIIRNLIIVLLFIIFFVFISNLRIKNIDVIGNENVESTEVIKNIIKSDFDRNLVIFLLKNSLFKNQNIPLIDTYDIKIKSLSRVEIIVKETLPILYMKADIKKVLVDSKGYVVGFSDKKVELPEVSGVNFLLPVKGGKIQINSEVNFLEIIKIASILKVNGIKIDLIEVNRDNELVLYIDKLIVEFGTINHIDIKLDRLIKVYDKIKDYKGKLDLKNARKNNDNEEYIFKKIN